MRYILMSDLGPEFCVTIATQQRLRASGELKREHLLTNKSIIPAMKYALKV